MTDDDLAKTILPPENWPDSPSGAGTVWTGRRKAIVKLLAAVRAEERERIATRLDKMEADAREESQLLSGLDVRSKMQRWQHAEAYKAAADAIRKG